MSAWPGKFVIGLTGNIATGKSVVRKMLEHLGAYGIDADALSHRATSKGAPGYEPIVNYFGRFILDDSGDIDRAKLGRLVFNDPDALVALEKIVHPLVRQAVDALVKRAPQEVIVIEAIKLLEGDLHQSCDTIWVVDAPENAQLIRLMQKRGLVEGEARIRISSQNPQQDKVKAAATVITNTGSFEDTWKQVSTAWNEQFPSAETSADPEPVAKPAETKGSNLAVQRAGPKQAQEIAELISRLSKGARQMNRIDVMEAFGEKAFMLLLKEEKLVGLAGWQVENLISRTTDFYIEPDIPLAEASAVLLDEVEKASNDLQSEASLVFVSKDLGQQTEIWQSLGYEKSSVDALGVRAWQEAARESFISGTEMFFKQLRVDRVLRPI
jgi:dephospho-CoA kinase